MTTIDNNQFEVKSAKRKIQAGPNVYLNPALDLLANEDRMVNTAMEITPHKRRKRTKSCDIATFENSALDLGISKSAVNEFLQRELQNVHNNFKKYDTPVKSVDTNDEPVYANLSEMSNIKNNLTDTITMPSQNVNETNLEAAESVLDVDSGISVLDNKSMLTTLTFNGDLDNNDVSAIKNTTNIQTNINNQIYVNNSGNINLSFIDRLALDSPGTSNQSLYFDDDLNESNIMEIKTITIITKKKLVPSKKNTNPFLDPKLNVNDVPVGDNPFLENETKPDLVYESQLPSNNAHNVIIPRKLFTNDTNSTISTVNDSLYPESHEYENVDSYRSESPIYENIGEDIADGYNKQSKILGCDVSQFSAVDIMNLNRSNQVISSESIDKKDLKHHLLKASNKLSKKVFRTLKKKFKGEKVDHNVTVNPYEVPRKPPKQRVIEKKDSGIANPALNLDNSDEIEIDELDDEHEYETIKTIRNTRLNTNVTPLKEKLADNFDHSQNSYTAGKKVRFDSTLNKEKIITGNSFDGDIQSPGFNAKIDKYHDELENCINERKFLQQNM